MTARVPGSRLATFSTNGPIVRRGTSSASGGQYGPALEHVWRLLHRASQMVVEPHTIKPGLFGGHGPITHLGPRGAERLEQDIDAHVTKLRRRSPPQL